VGEQRTRGGGWGGGLLARVRIFLFPNSVDTLFAHTQRLTLFRIHRKEGIVSRNVR
jgi:hypothetical protein